MKKAIFIVSVLFFLAGCKKEKIEPVEIPTKINNDTLLFLPSQAELTNGKIFTKCTYSYYPSGLIKKIEKHTTTNSKTIRKEYTYSDEGFSIKTTTFYNPNIIDETVEENFEFKNNQLKTYTKKLGNNIYTLNYFYKNNKISHSITNNLFYDSTVYQAYNDTAIIGHEKIFYRYIDGKPLIKGIDGIKHGSFYIKDRTAFLTYPNISSVNYKLSSLPNKFQKYIFNSFYEIFIGDFFDYETDQILMKNEYNFHIESLTYSGISLKFDHIVDANGRLIEIRTDKTENPRLKIFY